MRGMCLGIIILFLFRWGGCILVYGGGEGVGGEGGK